MKKWEQKKKTTAHRETRQERVSPDNNENTDAVTEEQVNQRIGQLLTQCLLVEWLSTALDLGVQSSSATPAMEEAMSFALWATANHIMSMSDQLRISMHTLQHSLWTTKSNDAREEALTSIEAYIEEVLRQFGE